MLKFTSNPAQILAAAALCLSAAEPLHAQAAAQAAMQTPMAPIKGFSIDVTEVSVGEFARFAAATGFVSAAERAGGGLEFDGGWQRRKGWTWRAPFGQTAAPNEPAVHLNFLEAKAFCQWAGKRLPTDAEWGLAAYTELRTQPGAGFETGKTYPYPTGNSPNGANCLGDCGAVSAVKSAKTSRGLGHTLVGSTKRGVNGLYDMGANAWEWVESGNAERGEKRTRGGSWWYGAESMRDAHRQTKPADTTVVYIGFRCAKSD